MEDQNIGKNCNYPNCMMLDYLNFVCNRCNKNLCKEHYHNVYSCPFSTNTEESSKINEMDFLVTKCSFCKGDILNSHGEQCQFCKKLFCLKHRLESDHKCDKMPNKSMRGRYEGVKGKFQEKLEQLKKNKK